MPYLNPHVVIQKHKINFTYVTCISRLDMTQSTLFTISQSLDRSQALLQAVTQDSA